MVDQDFLTSTFPKEQIKRRPDGFDYIEWTSVLERILAAFDGRFDWVVHSAVLTPESVSERKGKDGKPYTKRVPAYWTVTGTLTLPDLGSRSGIGTAVVETEEAPKSAESDALKRAAVKFGIALHLYDKHPLQPRQETRRETRQQNTHRPVRVEDTRTQAVAGVAHGHVHHDTGTPQGSPRNKCFALFTGINAPGIEPKDDAANRAWIGKLLGFPVESRSNLTNDHWSDIARSLGLFCWAYDKSDCPYSIQEIFNRVADRKVNLWTQPLGAWERCANWLRHEYQPDPNTDEEAEHETVTL